MDTIPVDYNYEIRRSVGCLVAVTVNPPYLPNASWPIARGLPTNGKSRPPSSGHNTITLPSNLYCELRCIDNFMRHPDTAVPYLLSLSIFPSDDR